jgi:hypothetical protein
MVGNWAGLVARSWTGCRRRTPKTEPIRFAILSFEQIQHYFHRLQEIGLRYGLELLGGASRLCTEPLSADRAAPFKRTRVA